MWCECKFSSLSQLYEGRMEKEERLGVFGNIGTVGGGVHAEGEDDDGGQGKVAEDQNHHDVQQFSRRYKTFDAARVLLKQFQIDAL